MTKTESASPELLTPRAMGVEDYPPYHFVLCKHSADNVPAIARAVADCDVVLIETVSLPEYAVRIIYEELNSYTHGDMDKKTADELLEANLDAAGDISDHFDLILAHALYGTGKLLLPIDAMDGTPENAKQNWADEYTGEFWRAIREDKISANTALRMLRDSLRLHADANRAREELVTKQLLQYPRFYDPGALKKIGVVQGAAHTGSYHDLRRQGIPASRQFVDPSGHISDSTYVFPPRESALRAWRFGVDKSLTKDLLGRILIEGILLPHIQLPPLDGRHEPEWDETYTTLRTEVIGMMSPGDRGDFLNAWESIRYSPAKGRKQRLRNLISWVIEKYSTDTD